MDGEEDKKQKRPRKLAKAINWALISGLISLVCFTVVRYHPCIGLRSVLSLDILCYVGLRTISIMAIIFLLSLVLVFTRPQEKRK